jgi:hypothetical protein
LLQPRSRTSIGVWITPFVEPRQRKLVFRVHAPRYHIKVGQ